MVPKLHKKGKSFRGAAAYLLHDKGRATSDERVAWTETRNLATADPHAAWRVMAATAIDQARLKEQAGIKSTGRKSKDHVLHLTLSWHPDEAEGLSREEMMRAGHGAIRALGADDHQVLFVCHDDEPQPHLHLLVNRVSPTDGRMLSSSKEKLNLSRWAERYEKERGRILCEERVINNAARDRGEYVRGGPDRPRHIFELEAANDNGPHTERIREEQRARDAEVARKARERRERHAAAWAKLDLEHRERAAAIREAALHDLRARVEGVRETFRPRWKELYHEHQAEELAFRRDEARFLGRMKNAFRVIRDGHKKPFNALSSSGARTEALKQHQLDENRRLAAQQQAEERTAAREIAARRSRELAANRTRLEAERSSLLLTQNMEHAATRSAWRTRGRDRRAAWEQNRFHGKAEGQKLRPSGRQSLDIDRDRQAAIEDFAEKMRQQLEGRDPEERGLDDDRGR